VASSVGSLDDGDADGDAVGGVGEPDVVEGPPVTDETVGDVVRLGLDVGVDDGVSDTADDTVAVTVAEAVRVAVVSGTGTARK
jgi:hypothetical protein